MSGYSFSVEREDTVGRIWRSAPYATLEGAHAEMIRVNDVVKNGGGDGLSFARVRMLHVTDDGCYYCERWP